MERKETYTVQENDYVITSLSGPVSLSYYKPNYKAIKPLNKLIQRPLILILESVPDQLENNRLCNPCSCIDRTNCCFQIDTPFFNVLNTLAVKNHDIQIYIDKNGKPQKNVTYNIMMTENYFEGKLANIFSEFLSYIVDPKDVDIMFQSSFSRNGFTKKELHQLFNNLFVVNKLDLNNFTNKLFELMKEKKTSLIYKIINDTIDDDYKELINERKIKEIYLNLINTTKDHNFDIFHFDVQTFKRNITNLETILSSVITINSNSSFLLMLSKWLISKFYYIELYIHIFSNLFDTSHKSLILCYLENIDVKLIEQIFFTSQNYNKTVEIPSIPRIDSAPAFLNRCLKIDKLLNLSDDVSIHNIQVDSIKLEQLRELHKRNPKKAHKPLFKSGSDALNKLRIPKGDKDLEEAIKASLKELEKNNKRNLLSYENQVGEVRECFTQILIDGDGNCLFRTIANYLIRQFKDVTEIQIKQFENEYSKIIRGQICDSLEKTYRDSRMNIGQAGETNQQYIAKMRLDKEYGGDKEMEEAANFYNIHIFIYFKPPKGSRPLWRLIESNNSDRVNAKYMYIIHVNENHFNLLLPNGKCQIKKIDQLRDPVIYGIYNSITNYDSLNPSSRAAVAPPPPKKEILPPRAAVVVPPQEDEPSPPEEEEILPPLSLEEEILPLEEEEQKHDILNRVKNIGQVSDECKIYLIKPQTNKFLYLYGNVYIADLFMYGKNIKSDVVECNYREISRYMKPDEYGEIKDIQNVPIYKQKYTFEKGNYVTYKEKNNILKIKKLIEEKSAEKKKFIMLFNHVDSSIAIFYDGQKYYIVDTNNGRIMYTKDIGWLIIYIVMEYNELANKEVWFMYQKIATANVEIVINAKSEDCNIHLKYRQTYIEEKLDQDDEQDGGGIKENNIYYYHCF